MRPSDKLALFDKIGRALQARFRDDEIEYEISDAESDSHQK
jgi:hypothetical protein